MQKTNYIFTPTICIPVGCDSLKRSKTELGQNKINPETSKSWPTKDPIPDGIPGISLEKLYRNQKVSQTANTIIVAVLDTPIHSNRESLQGEFWHIIQNKTKLDSILQKNRNTNRNETNLIAAQQNQKRSTKISGDEHDKDVVMAIHSAEKK